jgi:hypothetical protein
LPSDTYKAPKVVPDPEVPGKEEDEEPPDKIKKKKASPKPNPYPENPKFPQIFACNLCPRNLCTHVEIHHASQFSQIKYGTNKFSAMLRIVQEWVRDIKKEPVVVEKEAGNARKGRRN